jgi:predicted metal-dependent phosphoesterase TrpH
MTQRTELALSELYTEDETAWLDAMVDLLHAGGYAELDFANLREYLSDMAKRDRREVESRLVILLAHILKWVHQPDQRSRSWRASIVVQRQELNRLASRGVLRKHAESVLAEVYQEALERAAVETGLPVTAFPAECGYSVDEVLSFDPVGDTAGANGDMAR